MGLTYSVNRSDLEAGDHIYTYRGGIAYSHHGIYVGENKVIHFTRYDDIQSSSISTSFSSSAPNVQTSRCSDPECGLRAPESGVTKSCLDCFLRGGSLYRYLYGVGSRAFMNKSGGTCTTARSDPPEEVIFRAIYLLQHGFGKYHLFCNNCEDFALYCKTSLLLGERKGLIGSRSGQLAGNRVRYVLDIGVRKDVVRVRVEDVAMHLANHLFCNNNAS